MAGVSSPLGRGVREDGGPGSMLDSGPPGGGAGGRLRQPRCKKAVLCADDERTHATPARRHKNPAEWGRNREKPSAGPALRKTHRRRLKPAKNGSFSAIISPGPTDLYGNGGGGVVGSPSDAPANEMEMQGGEIDV